MTIQQITTLHAAFRTLQPEIREWLTSDEVLAATGAIAERLILSRAQEIQLPLLIVRLVTQNIPPESFKAEVVQALTLSPEVAEQIISSIVETILAPIAPALSFAGVDVALVGFNAPTTPFKLPEASPPTPFKYQETNLNKPFILHEEPPAPRVESPRPSFLFVPSESARFEKTAAPPKVTIERIVHYTNLRSSLTEPNASAPANAPTAIQKPNSKWFT